MRGRQTERGQTLIEVAMACAIMVVIFGAGLSISVETQKTWDHVYKDTGAVHSLREGLALLAADLATSAPDQVTVVAGEDHDTLLFRVPVAIAGDDLTWGAGGEAAYSIRVSVQGGDLVRQVLDGDDQPVGPSRILVSDVDGLHDGAKGFAASVSGTLCTVTARVESQSNGRTWRKAATTAVQMRN